MHADAVAYPSGLYIDKSPEYPQPERIGKLVQIAVEQSEKNSGEKDGCFFAVFYSAVYEQLAEDQLLEKGGAKYHNDHSGPWTDVHYNIHHRVVHRGTFDHADEKGHPKSHKVA